jgi:hypothetical protein
MDRSTIYAFLLVVLTSPTAPVLLIVHFGWVYGILMSLAFLLAQTWVLKKILKYWRER